tara:strand:+ start:268 stop:648 length:381 start_codon:yes stop_codon:yes gene_type:complete
MVSMRQTVMVALNLFMQRKAWGLSNMFSIQNKIETLLLHFNIAIGSTDGIAEEDKQVMAHLASESMGWSWVVYEAEFSGDDMLFFGRVNGFASELGYFTWGELALVEDLKVTTSHMDKSESSEMFM